MGTPVALAGVERGPFRFQVPHSPISVSARRGRQRDVAPVSTRLPTLIALGIAIGAFVGLGLNAAATTGALDRTTVLAIAGVGQQAGKLFLRPDAIHSDNARGACQCGALDDVQTDTAAADHCNGLPGGDAA